MPPFKNELGPAAGRRLARVLAEAWPAFPERQFSRGLAEALEPLELLARGHELAERLGRALPESFADAATVLYRALRSDKLTGWIVLPCGTFVANAGINGPERALPLLAALTPRWSSEFAVRPFIKAHPARTYEYLTEWTAHSDEHVRRLVSEGTRPRLPWATQLRELIADPAPNLPLLDALVDDPSAYVRRSVANHLNDISKDHPDLAASVAEQWLALRSSNAERVVRHGLWSLVKRGDERALVLVGADTSDGVDLVDFTVDRDRITIGEAVTFSFTLAVRKARREPLDVLID